MTGDYPKIISSPEHLRHIEKDKYSTALTDRPLWKQRCGRWPGEEWGENEKDWVWVEKAEKKMAAVLEKECFMQL